VTTTRIAEEVTATVAVAAAAEADDPAVAADAAADLVPVANVPVEIDPAEDAPAEDAPAEDVLSARIATKRAVRVKAGPEALPLVAGVVAADPIVQAVEAEARRQAAMELRVTSLQQDPSPLVGGGVFSCDW